MSSIRSVELIESTLIQPTFVTHLPKELVPLAKLSPDDPPARTKPLRRGEGPTTVEVCECCINGQEISPGDMERNKPLHPPFAPLYLRYDNRSD